jgi:putative colanic acid biosynthesis UDP-glucose lipid carrier transferase
MEKRVEHDIWYMENWSIALDIKILFMTVLNVIKGEENAY